MEKNYENQNVILLTLLEPYIKDKYTYIFALIVLTILINVIQTIGISSIISNIIQFIEKKNIQKTFLNFNYFVGICVLYLVLFLINKKMQSSFLADFVCDIRMGFFEYIITLNNTELFTGNLTVLNNLMNKISNNTYYAFNELIDNFISNIIFILIIFIYISYNNFAIGLIFLLGNLVIICCYLFSLDGLIEGKKIYKSCTEHNEDYVDDIYLNIEKVISSGTTSKEIDFLNKQTKKCNRLINNYDNDLITINLCITIFTYITICSILWYSIKLNFKNKINNNILITIITLILIYRERVYKISDAIGEFLEFYVKTVFMENRINFLVNNAFNDPNKILYVNKNKYIPVNLNFNTIQFKNVTFGYNDKPAVLKNFNEIFNTDNNKIIGITGKSGQGKSSLVKMIMKLYNNYEGDIFIDNTNIKDIDPTYIRNNITYIPQNGILLDRLIIDNIMYGCANKNLCEENLNIIMSYNNISEIFKKIDIYGESGKLGQSLSGGQRQVINIINGLIKPTKILIIDEPTNALDPNLKKEVLDIIHQFKKYKQSIIIITHDKDVYKIMDENVQI